jgi:hypothetical protein
MHVDISGSHGGEYEDDSLLKYTDVSEVGTSSIFRALNFH